MAIIMEEDSDSRTDQTKKAVAILVTCIVQTLGESDATFQKRFVERVGKAYQDVRDNMGTDCLETLNWVREILDADDLSSILHHLWGSRPTRSGGRAS